MFNLTKKKLIIYIVLHTIFFSIIISTLIYEKKSYTKNYFQSIFISKKKIYNEQLKYIYKEADLIHDLIITKKIINILKEAKKSKLKARTELIKTLYPTYNMLTKYGIKQLQFHLPNGISFVRFHDIHRYNDELYNFRPSIKYTQTTLKPYHGFEVGKVVSAFRNVYPIIENNKLLGSVGISFDINKIHDLLNDSKIIVIIKKRIISQKFFKEINNNFQTCKLNTKYFVENPQHIFKKSHNLEFDKFNIIENKLVLAYPLLNGENKKEGYVLLIQNIKNIAILNEINKNFKTSIISLIIIYFLILFILIYLYIYSQLKIKAETDKLTKILNRQGCENKIKNLKSYSLLLFDIDFFKKVNDTYGHDIGDMILQQFAKIIKNNIRESDIFCRWGGEEFILILPNQNHPDEVAEKLRKIVEKAKFPKDLKITVSIGISRYIDDFDKMYKQADEKLYISKKEGRNRVTI